MTTDDDTRDIEAALMSYGAHCLYEGRSGGGREQIQKTQASFDRLLALIRQKLEGNVAQKTATYAQPAADVAQNDAEHERAVEMWRLEATSYVREGLYVLHDNDIDEALRLMRARPAGRDWPEDAADADNGHYQCRCITCGSPFTGHKRRVQCKVCARPAIEVHSFTGTDSSYEKLVAREAAAGELLRAAKVVAFEGLTNHHDAPRLIPSEKLRESLSRLRERVEAAERAGVR